MAATTAFEPPSKSRASRMSPPVVTRSASRSTRVPGRALCPRRAGLCSVWCAHPMRNMSGVKAVRAIREPDIAPGIAASRSVQEPGLRSGADPDVGSCTAGPTDGSGTGYRGLRPPRAPADAPDRAARPVPRMPVGKESVALNRRLVAFAATLMIVGAACGGSSSHRVSGGIPGRLRSRPPRRRRRPRPRRPRRRPRRPPSRSPSPCGTTTAPRPTRASPTRWSRPTRPRTRTSRSRSSASRRTTTSRCSRPPRSPGPGPTS